MTYDTGGYQPPSTTTASDRPTLAEGTATGGATTSGSTTETAKDQAAAVGQTAVDAGGQVASTATEQARNVATEAQRQARDLLGEATSQVREQASTQQQRAAGGLRSIGDELRSMAERSERPGPATDLARQAADKVQELAGWLEQRDPGSLLDEVRGLARRKPGSFLLGAALAGVAAGRLTRGVVAGQSAAGGGAAGSQPGSLATSADGWPATAGTAYGEQSLGDGGYGQTAPLYPDDRLRSADPSHGQDATGVRNPATGSLAADAPASGTAAGVSYGAGDEPR